MKKQILDKIRLLNISFENQSDTSTAAPPENLPGDGLDAFIKRVMETPVPEQDRNDQEWRSGLNKLVAELDTDELAEFIRALLYEDPDLMTVLRFIPSRYASQTALVFDWAMNLPYATLKRTFDILERLFEEALAQCKTDERAASVIAKIKAITAKHHDGLPFSYLRRKAEQTDLDPKLRLELAQLMLQHQDYDLDFEEAEEMLNVPKQPFMLPALMETYLRDEEEGPYKALRLLNTIGEKSFPPKGMDLEADIEYVLEEIARTLKKAEPGSWKKKLTAFVEQELTIANSFLRNMVEGVFEYLKGSLGTPAPGPEEYEPSADEQLKRIPAPSSSNRRTVDPLDAAFDQFFQEGNMQAFLMAVEQGGLEEIFSMSVDWTLTLKPVDLGDKASELIQEEAVSW